MITAIRFLNSLGEVERFAWLEPGRDILVGDELVFEEDRETLWTATHRQWVIEALAGSQPSAEGTLVVDCERALPKGVLNVQEWLRKNPPPDRK